MTIGMTVIPYGNAESKEKARALLENLPQVKRVDCAPDISELRLFLLKPLHENSLIPQLAQSGISGFRLIHD